VSNEVYAQLPMPLLIGVMVLGIVLVLLACTPTAWVDRVHKAIRRYNSRPS
jgi:hypothetical protein